MQLLIVDIQETYRKYCHHLINKIPEFSKNFSQVIYLFDNIDGQDLYEELPAEWMEEENEEFYNGLKILTKQYAFFRGLMDAGVDENDEELIKLARFLRKHNLIDAREIFDIEEVLSKYQEEFKHSPLQNINFNDYSFYLPEDLLLSLEEQVKPGVILIGGGRNECLKEVSLLLKVLDINHSINEEYTY